MPNLLAHLALTGDKQLPYKVVILSGEIRTEHLVMTVREGEAYIRAEGATFDNGNPHLWDWNSGLGTGGILSGDSPD